MLKPDFENLKLLGSICLRRSTPTILCSLGVAFTECRPCLSEAERRAYDELAVSCGQSIKAAVNRRSTKGGIKSILTAVLRLRIFCNTGLASHLHGTLEDAEEQLQHDEVISLLEQSGDPIGVKSNSGISSLEGGNCSERRRSSSRPECSNQAPSANDTRVFTGGPQCSTVLAADNFVRQAQANDEPGYASTNDTPDRGSYPSKLVALLADIKEHYSQDKR
jgi:hypothetical protein